MTIIVRLLRVLTGALIVATALPALLALMGGIVPALDLINHLQFLLFGGTVGVLILALVVRMKRAFLLLAVIGCVASGTIFLPEWASGLAPRPSRGDATVLKLMTHNIFGLNYDMRRLADAIAAEDPDIVALQEYFPQQARALSGLLAASYPYSAHCFGGKRANLALYSKLPFTAGMTNADCPGTAFGTKRTAFILAHFTLEDGSTFSVMTTHMDWPYPIERQASEMRATANVARTVEGPLVLVGDFNSTPWSFGLKTFADQSGLDRQTRNLLTYPTLFTLGDVMRTWPFLALDQVFTRGLDVHELHRGAETGSDHLPVIFSFSVPAASL